MVSVEVNGVEEGVHVVDVDGAYCCHRFADGAAPDEFLEQARDALGGRCSLDWEGEGDEVGRGWLPRRH